MAKRKSLNKRFSRYSRSNGSDVLNPDTNVLDDEQPYWWRKLENNTIARPSIDSANFNQTSRRLDSNFSIRTSNDLDDDWWKVLERTPHNLKPLQKSNDLSKKDANNGAPGTSESEEEVKITKKKPPLRSEVKKVDGNAFLSALNDSRVLLIPLEKDPAIQRSSFAERFASTSGISNDSKQLNKDNDMEPRMTEISHLSNSTLPKATSTPVESSIVFQHTNVGNSSSDIEPVVKKPKSKLLKRHNRDVKKNLFENILMEDKIDEEEATDRPIPNANAMMDKSAEEPESRIGEDESTLEDANANKRLQPTEKTNLQDSENDFSDTSKTFLEPAKPKSRFLRQTRTSTRENLFQRILEDSDSWITKAVSNLSRNSNSTRTMRRPSVISAESNDCTEDMHLRLSYSSNASDVNIIRTDNNKISSSRNSHVEIASSQSEDRISNAMKTSRERSVLSNENENDKDSDVTLLTPASESPSMQSRSIVPSDIIPLQSEACARQQCQKNSGADKEAVASLRKGSVEIKDLADAENIEDAYDTEFQDLNTSRKRLTSCSAQEIAVEETAITQQTIKSQEHSGVAIFNGERTEHDEEAALRRSRSFSFKTNVNATSVSQALSNPQMEQEIRKKLDEIKKRELERIEEVRKLPVVGERNKFGKGTRPQPKRQNFVPRKVDKAYMVNGLVYKPPRLPRPKKWVTDHLYQHLWKQMEPKFKLETRVQSEKFVSRLSEVTDVIAKRKTYPSYKNELHALMKEMARLQIIRSRHDFYNFCHEFLPYELRVKMVPILLPGNQRTIPYDPKKLYQPLLSA